MVFSRYSPKIGRTAKILELFKISVLDFPKGTHDILSSVAKYGMAFSETKFNNSS